MTRKFTRYYLTYAAIFLITAVSMGIFYNGQRPNISLSAEASSDKETTEQSNPDTVATSQENVEETNDLSGLNIPILMYHHIRTFNDPNDQVGTNLSVPPENFAAQLDYIQKQGYETITLSDLEKGMLPEKPAILTFDDGYDNFYDNAYPELKRRNMKAVLFVITGSIDKAGYVTEDEIKEIEENGVEIGAHSVSHPDLTKVQDNKVAKEIATSKAVLENLINKSVVSFCYPAGKFNAEVEQVVKDSGYKYAVTTNSGITSFGDNFALNRYRINNGSSIKNYFK